MGVLQATLGRRCRRKPLNRSKINRDHSHQMRIQDKRNLFHSQSASEKSSSQKKYSMHISLFHRRYLFQMSFSNSIQHSHPFIYAYVFFFSFEISESSAASRQTEIINSIPISKINQFEELRVRFRHPLCILHVSYHLCNILPIHSSRTHV